MKKLLVALVIGTLLALPLSAMAMEKMSGTDLNDVTGQAGVNIAFGGTSTTSVSFSAVAWGDNNGYDTAAGAGWLIIEGDTAVLIEQEIADGEIMELDIATGQYVVAASTTIPAGTTFIAVTLPGITTDITTPETLNVQLGGTSTTPSGTLGVLRLGGLSIEQGTPDKLFIWAD